MAASLLSLVHGMNFGWKRSCLCTLVKMFKTPSTGLPEFYFIFSKIKHLLQNKDRDFRDAIMHNKLLTGIGCLINKILG